MKHIFMIASWLLCMASAMANSNWSNCFISYKDGLAATRVNDIIQDSQGYIWMGSDMGLSRFDGSHLINFEWLGYADRRVAANIGNMYLDEKNQLLWMRTRKYTYQCYSLSTGRFLDYGTAEQQQDSYRRNIMTRSGIWLCDAKEGLRHIEYRNGQLVCTDYKTALGNLPKGDALRLAEDNVGNIWGIVGENIIVITPNGKITVKAKNVNVYRIAIWKDRILFLTKKGKLFMYNSKGKLVRTEQMPKEQCNLGSQNTGFIWNNKWIMLTSRGTHVYDLIHNNFYIDGTLQMDSPRMLDNTENTYFIGSQGTLCVFADGQPMLRLPLMEGMNITGDRNRRFSSTVGADGRYYIATFGNGLFIYNPKNGQMEHHTANDAVPLITSDFLTDILLDKQGNVWLAQEEAGVVCIGKDFEPDVDIYEPVAGARGGWRNNICFISQCDKDGNMIVGTRDNRYYTFSPATGHFQKRGELPVAVYAYLKDSKGREWFGTRGNGLYVDGKQYTSLDKNNYVPDVAIHDLVEDGNGRIWAATNDAGLLELTLTADGKMHYRQFLNKDINTSRISRLFLEKRGRLWIASNGGLMSIDTKAKNITEKAFVIYKSLKNNRPFDEINIAYRANSNGKLYAGTLGRGVISLSVDKTGKTIKQDVIDKQTGLHGNHISSITEDRQGNIWIGTSTHISRIDGKTGRMISFDMPYAIEHAYLTRGMARLLPDGRILFATSEGLLAVNPKSIKQTSRPPFNARVTDVSINGFSVYKDENMGKLYKDGQFTLPYDHNNLCITFSDFNYAHKESTVYQYWLEGHDKTWNESTSETSVSYDKLAPGRYVFHVRTIDNNNNEEDKFSSLVIIIERPWWNTWWAWTVYLIIIGTAAWWFYRNWHRRFELQQEMKLQQQVTDFRLEFFTHVTHEFRTPLAIISGAVDKMSDKNPETVSRKTIQTVKRGATRLRQLVDRLMEFRKISTGNMSLKVEQGDLVTFLKDLIQDFWTISQQKQQTLTFTPYAKQCTAYFDRHIVDTIVYNLISNAVKYTPDRGCIELQLTQTTDNRLLITVEDNGPGIAPERQKDMYSPFMHGNASAGGMGIGLYTAMNMAKTHKGTLEYENTGHGSKFTLAIPANDDAYDAADYNTMKALETDDAEETKKAEEIIHELMPNPMNDIRIAIIEDEPDMLEQLQAELTHYFIVDTYATGNAGLEGIKTNNPSLLVCDVMLPDTNGYDIVRKMKADAATAQIPVILLTALDDTDHQIKGYKAGADDYMVKPCNIAVLVARIAQLIQWSRNALTTAQTTDALAEQQTDTNQLTETDNTDNAAEKKTSSQSAEGQIITSQLDRVFLDRLEAIVSQHACEPTFSVDTLAEMMHTGRTKFYGRCKELTGLSPNKYVLQVRMTRAGEMLLTGEKTVAEVCYAVGFSDPSHFNKCFKAYYGVAPSKYGK